MFSAGSSRQVKTVIAMKKKNRFILTYRQIKRLLIADAVMLLFAFSFVIFSGNPAIVEGLSVKNSTYSTADITWKKSENAKSYRIYRSTDGNNYDYLTTTADNKYTDKDLRTGTKYLKVLSTTTVRALRCSLNSISPMLISTHQKEEWIYPFLMLMAPSDMRS